MEELFSLNNGAFLIAGGTRGIGRAISLRFARAGARVIAVYVRDERAALALEKEAQEERLDVSTCRADITSQKGLALLDECVGKDSGSLSGLVYCAATGVHKDFVDLSSRHFDWTLSLNVRAFFELVKMLLPRFCRPAAIVALSSQGARQAVPGYSLVGASKGALESLARHMAIELAAQGIRVNILSPGPVRTEAWKALPDADKRLATAEKRTPLGRLVTPEDTALAAQYLCSAAAEGIVGQTIIIDGGLALVGE